MKRNRCAGQSFLIWSISFAALLALALAACGSSGGPVATPAPTPTPTSSIGNGAAHGCPSDAVVSPAPPAANVTIKLSDANRTVTAHIGDVIEIQLPFGLRWSGPTISGVSLQLQTPAGYASTALAMCIWRFSALQAGTSQLTFTASALCLKGQSCPQFSIAVSFTIATK